MIKAITFDFWQTLYADSSELSRKRQAMRAERCHQFLVERGYHCTPTEVDDGFQAAYHFVTERWHRHRGVTENEWIQVFFQTLQLNFAQPALDGFVKFIGEVLLDTPPVLLPYIREVLPELSTKYRLGVISDTGLTPGRVLRQLMERSQILQYFTVQTFSDETMYTKPEAVQFHSTLRRLNVEPVEAVHIGDLVRTDIVGAKNAGMKAIRFSGVTMGQDDAGLSDAVIDDYRHLGEIIARLDNSRSSPMSH
ncbi:HAD family hydrolase [Candidatus Poribacteria bacterium]|nr:HAD family hydrolase [Candidatus Poribacteria bacterium]